MLAFDYFMALFRIGKVLLGKSTEGSYFYMMIMKLKMVVISVPSLNFARKSRFLLMHVMERFEVSKISLGPLFLFIICCWIIYLDAL